MKSTKPARRPISVLLFAMVFVLAACGGGGVSSSDTSDGGTTASDAGTDSTPGDAGASGEVTELTVLGTLKPEIATQFEAAVEAWNASQSLYQLAIVPLPVGEFLQTATAMYSSGNAPTMMVMSQEIPEFQDRLLDLSGTEVVEAALPGTLNQSTLEDGRVVGVPQTIEAYGLLYNQAVVDEAVGGTFDPSTIQTRSDLLGVMDQVAELGSTQAAIHISPMDWSLGAHLTNMLYSPQSPDRDARLAFIEDLKAGSVSLTGNEVFNGWMDTVDALLVRNQLATSPLAAEYDDGVLALANGDVGFWFMGNWALPNLTEANPDADFGIMPVPVNDSSGAYGNAQISIGVPAFIVVDAEQSTEAQQQGAIEFLNWLVTTEEGAGFYVDEFQFLPAYSTIEEPPADQLSQQILGYASDDAALEWMNSLYPADGWPTFGASMQKYLAGQADRAGLAGEFEAYWTSVEG
jgi:raffinose/stachyose/melibiose transport system substrate-binding protein